MSFEIKTLVVEDDPTFREVIREYLSIYHDVTVVPDLGSARKSLAEREFDLVLLDKKLPDGTGLDLLVELNNQYPKTAVVILTSDGDFNSLARALELGADDYLVKSEHLVHNLLLRFPIALKHARNRVHLSGLRERSNVRIPDREEEFTEKSYLACMDGVEREYLLAAITACGGNIPRVAERLNISRSTLFRKLSELGITKKTSETETRESTQRWKEI